jgi:rRNA processing protein Gar1
MGMRKDSTASLQNNVAIAGGDQIGYIDSDLGILEDSHVSIMPRTNPLRTSEYSVGIGFTMLLNNS